MPTTVPTLTFLGSHYLEGSRHDSYKRDTKLFVVFGENEKTNGITYVGLSRNEDINDVCIGNAITLDRITEKIQSKSLRIRLLEDKRLCDLSEGTKIFYNLI